MTDASADFQTWFDQKETDKFVFVLFNPFGPIDPQVEAYRAAVAKRTGIVDPLYNGYDWAMLFHHHLVETVDDIQLDGPARSVPDTEFLLAGSSDDVMVILPDDASAKRIIAALVSLLKDTDRVDAMLKDGKAQD